jgi:hypothetical protein
MERDDTGWKLFSFGMNDEDGRLIEIKIPAQSQAEAVRKIKTLLFRELCEDDPKNKFWLNEEEDYR